jgi:succinate dehydrogenase / fumarate reductase, cytochrome b subunit
VSAMQRDTSNVGAGNWKGVGMWAWILFRISGLVLLGYLFVHVWVISQGRVNGPQSLNDLFKFFDRPFLYFLDLMLVAAVLYHALNGVRVVLMDLGIGIRDHKSVYWMCMVVAAAALAVFALKASTYIF